MSKAKAKPPEPPKVPSWETVRNILLEEYTNQGINLRDLLDRGGIPRTTSSQVLQASKDVQLTNLLKLLMGLGKDLAWLQRKLNAIGKK